jgi:hypothetical protein
MPYDGTAPSPLSTACRAMTPEGRQMFVKELKDLVRDEAYIVDPQLVAAAVLRRAAEGQMGQRPITRRGAHARATPDSHLRRWR